MDFTTQLSPLHQHLWELPGAMALESVIDKLRSAESKRVEDWMRGCFEKHAPGVVGLMDSGQQRAASIHASLQGFRMLVHQDGGRTLERHRVKLAYLPPVKPFWKPVDHSRLWDFASGSI